MQYYIQFLISWENHNHIFCDLQFSFNVIIFNPSKSTLSCFGRALYITANQFFDKIKRE